MLNMSYDIYSAFGNSVRNKLIICLHNKSKNVTELIDNCGIAQSAVSQHLSKLKKSGLVKSEKLGKEVYYALRFPDAGEIAKSLVKLEKEAKLI